MNTRDIVKAAFDMHIRRKLKTKPVIAEALVSHERKELVIDHACDQVRMAERGMKRRLNRRDVVTIAEASASLFMSAGVEHFEQRALSQAEKARRVTEQGAIQEAEGMIHELSQDMNRPETSFLNDTGTEIPK